MPSGGPRTAAIRRMPPGPAAAPAAAATNGNARREESAVELDAAGCWPRRQNSKQAKNVSIFTFL